MRAFLYKAKKGNQIMTKISDIARETGFSITTISRAINNHPNVSQKTKEKIFAAMKEFGYYPNSVAQQLRGQKTKLIGVIISYITNPFFTHMVDAIERYAYRKGYQIVVLQTLERAEREQKFIEMLQKNQLDGLIMTSIENDSDEIVALIHSGKIVVCNRYLGDKDIGLISIDSHKAVYEGVYYLLSKGYRKIAYCTGGAPADKDYRFEGFMQALGEFEIEFNPEYHYFKQLRIEDGKQTLIEMLRLGKNRPDAIFANSDEVASGILKQCHVLNVKVPDDLAIIGFDDQPVASLTYPSLTTVRQPIKQMGEYVARLLIAKLNDTPLPEEPDLRTTLIIRETT